MAKKKAFDYFEAFENLAGYAVEEADILLEAVSTFDYEKGIEEYLERAHVVEHEGDEIIHTVSSHIATEFITPIEREDIVSLSRNFDNVIDQIEAVLQRFFMYDVRSMHAHAIEFAEVIRNACVALKAAAGEFRNFKKAPASLRENIIKVNDFEEEGDRLYLWSIRELYTDERDDAVGLAVWTDLFRCMETCCDATEHAADSMDTVLLKNS